MIEDIKNEIFELTKKGLLIDFSNIYVDEKCIGLNFYTIGHYDDMYNNLKRNKIRANINDIDSLVEMRIRLLNN